MNIILLFFALPVATIILAIVLQKILKSPILVAATFFAIFLIVTFAAFDASFLVFALVYTLLAFFAATIVQAICKFIRKCCNNNCCYNNCCNNNCCNNNSDENENNDNSDCFEHFCSFNNNSNTNTNNDSNNDINNEDTNINNNNFANVNNNSNVCGCSRNEIYQTQNFMRKNKR